MLAPRLHRAEVLDPLREYWRERGSVRVEPAFRERDAASFLESLRISEHVPHHDLDPTTGYQAWRFGWVPGTDCDHPLCLLGRWLRADGLRWFADLTELALSPNPDPMLISDQAAKASYFEAYNEADGRRAVAFQVHLTPATWPADWGGHLELLEGRDGPVIERCAPAWNALDLFDVRGPGAWRRKPLLLEHVDGYTVSGWFHEAGSSR